MALTEYEADRLDEFERKPELTTAEARLRDAMRDAEPDQARAIALKASEKPAPGASKAAAGEEPQDGQRIRTAELRGVLAEFGVPRDDIDDAMTLLDGALAFEYDRAALEGAVTALQERRPEMFGSPRPATPKPSMSLPAGRPGGKGTPQSAQFGAGGVEAAKQRGWVTE